MTQDPTRPSRRQVSADATRSEILAAARRLFVGQGYGNTSVAEVAEEAGVAIQTIYSSVGTKRALLLAFNDFVDQESGLLPLAQEAFSTTEPRVVLQLGAQITRQLAERCGDLIDTIYTASDTEPEAAEVIGEGRRRHAASCAGLVARVHELGGLRDDLSIDDAGVVLATATQWTVWADFVRSGWTYDRAEQWVTESLISLLLAPGRE